MTNTSTDNLISRIQRQSRSNGSVEEHFEAAMLSQSVLHNTLGSGHPVARAIAAALDKGDYTRALAGANTVVSMFESGALTNPRLAIAHEIEGELLDTAQLQVQAAEREPAMAQKTMRLAIAAFLSGAALEDALRRLCIENSLAFDAQKSSLSKLQALLFQPSNQIEIISSSDNKQITAWGDTRNKADHGKFDEITQSEVFAMVIGVRSFLDRRLP